MSKIETSKQLILYGFSAFLGIFLFSWGVGYIVRTNYTLLAIIGYFMTPIASFIIYDYKTGKANISLLIVSLLLNAFAGFYGIILYSLEVAGSKGF